MSQSNGTVPDCAAVSLMETFGRDAEDAAHTEVVIKKTLASIHGGEHNSCHFLFTWLGLIVVSSWC